VGWWTSSLNLRGTASDECGECLQDVQIGLEVKFGSDDVSHVDGSLVHRGLVDVKRSINAVDQFSSLWVEVRAYHEDVSGSLSV